MAFQLADVLDKQVEVEEAGVHEKKIARIHKALTKRLGCDPGHFVCAAYYITEDARLIENPVLIDRNELNTLKNSAFKDELTGLGNRRLYNIALEKEFSRAKRTASPFALIMADIDYFKQFNDTHGHQAGDQVLSELSRIMLASCRISDFSIRYGGEEFAFILPATSLAESMLVAERMRKRIEEETSKTNLLTMSFGVSEFKLSDKTFHDVVDRADKALYCAKNLGKNTVCTHQEDMRRDPRFEVDIPVLLQWENGSSVNAVGQSMNISRGGLLVKSTKAPESTMLCDLCLYDPKSGQSLSLKAHLRGVKQADSGRSLMSYEFVVEERDDSFDNFFAGLIFNNNDSCCAH